MYPVLFRFGEFEITSFGVLLAIATLVAWQVFARELRVARLSQAAADLAFYAIFWGFVGAKVSWAIEHVQSQPLVDSIFSRGGLSWFGGFIGGVGSGILFMVRRQLPLLPTLSAATPALAVGHLIGRLGCFFVGDDYGVPSSLPWAVAFPQGQPPVFERVHPTQLYEAAWLAVVMWWLIRWRRSRVADEVVLARYLILTAAFRFLLEFIRVGDKVALGLTVAQWLSSAVLMIGLSVMFSSYNRSRFHRAGTR